MRIEIQGGNDAARELKAMLQSQGYAVTNLHPTHRITLEEDATLTDYFVLDGIECPLERRVMEHVCEQTNKNPMLARVGGIQSDHELRLRFSPADAHQVAVGAFRGILETITNSEFQIANSAKPWWKGIFK